MDTFEFKIYLDAIASGGNVEFLMIYSFISCVINEL